jgi:alpha-beta hydrolase superfamily lysophospholipase
MKTADGLQLHTHHWPAQGSAHGARRGTVVLSHGLGEHLGRYAHVAAFFNRLGWDACGLDHRGHGLSEGKRGDIAEPDSLLRDLGQFIGTVRAAHPTRAVLLLGHSMGALLAARYVAEGLMAQPQAWHQPVSGLVLSSPPIDMGLGLLQRALLAVTPALLPRLPRAALRTWATRSSTRQNKRQWLTRCGPGCCATARPDRRLEEAANSGCQQLPVRLCQLRHQL